MPARHGTERRRNPYRSLFSAPGTGAFAAAGMAARMAHGMTLLATILLVSAVSGSYTAAGLVAAAYALSYSVVSPLAGRIVDRRRQGPVLIPMAMANTAARLGFLCAAWLAAPAWCLVLVSGLAGATMPAVGSLVRARWSYVFRGSPLLNTAMSVESVADELIFVLGSIAVSMSVTFVHPAAGLVLALLLSGAGLTALAGQRRTEPPVIRHEGPTGTPLAAPGFVVLMLTFVALGTMSGFIELATVAFSSERGAQAWSGWVLATIAAGSCVTGLWYGARDWHSPAQRRMSVTLALLTAATLLFVAAPGIWPLFGAALLLGAALGPTMIAGFSVVSACVPARQLTEGLAWITTAMGLGISLGATVAGVVLDRWGPTAGFAIAAGCAATATLTSLLATGRRRTAEPAGSDPPTTGAAGQDVR